jgi:hypothetical protein
MDTQTDKRHTKSFTLFQISGSSPFLKWLPPKQALKALGVLSAPILLTGATYSQNSWNWANGTNPGSEFQFYSFLAHATTAA